MRGWINRVRGRAQPHAAAHSGDSAKPTAPVPPESNARARTGLTPKARKVLLVACCVVAALVVLPPELSFLLAMGLGAIFVSRRWPRSSRQRRWYRDVYLQSEHWRHTRRAAFRIHGQRCAGCGSRHSLDVHHVRYGNLWRENPAVDLQVLCRDCHDEKH